MPGQNRHASPQDKYGLNTVVGRALLSTKRAIGGVGVFSFFINLLMLTGPIYMLQVYDRVLVSRSMSTLVALSLLMLALYAFMGLLDFCRSRILTRLAYKIETDLGGRTFRLWLQRGSLTNGQDHNSPLSDLASLRQFLSGSGPSTFFDVPWVPAYIAVIFLLHWSLGVLAVIGAAIIFLVALYNEISTRKSLAESLDIRREEAALTGQAHRNAEAIQAMGMGRFLQTKWQRLNADGTRMALVSNDRTGNASSFTKAFRMFIQSAILGLGGALAIKQIITPGAMIAGSIILGRALSPVQMAISQWRSFGAARSAYTRLNDLHETYDENSQNTRLPDPKGFLTAENMTAGPPGAVNATVRGINFKLKPGAGLGVVGPSASGKSTLAKLLAGVWMPQKGKVRLDGATFDQWDRNALGAFIGYLPQSVELFNGTVGQNIARFDPNATSEQIVKAAQIAGVHDLILRLFDGYDTVLGEGGTVLSGGQVQRIALARALYGDPVLLILDEPDSSLDSDGDLALRRAIAAMRKQGCTVIVMAHRRGAIASLDTLLVLKDGQQVDYGAKADVQKRFAANASQKTPPKRTEVKS